VPIQPEPILKRFTMPITNAEITPSSVSKAGGLTIKQVAHHSGKTRQWLRWQFVKDQLVFEEILFDAMKKQCEIDMNVALEKVQQMLPNCNRLISEIASKSALATSDKKI
jgi:hypothetical protein